VLRAIHHAAIIASDYQVSKHFYTQILGLKIHAEHYRAERDRGQRDYPPLDPTHCLGPPVP
jgi:glyoxylase I family protein